MSVRSSLLDDSEEPVKKEEFVELKEERKHTSAEAPLRQVRNLRKNRTKRGTGSVTIGGVPVDVFDIEDMVIKVSPSDMKTVQRYDNARIIEVIRNTQRPKLSSLGGANWGLILLLIIAAGGFLVFALFGGDILNALSGMFKF